MLGEVWESLLGCGEGERRCVGKSVGVRVKMWKSVWGGVEGVKKRVGGVGKVECVGEGVGSAGVSVEKCWERCGKCVGVWEK